MAKTAKITLFQLNDDKWSYRVKYPSDESSLVRATMATDEYDTKEDARAAAEAQARAYAQTEDGSEQYEYDPTT